MVEHPNPFHKPITYDISDDEKVWGKKELVHGSRNESLRNFLVENPPDKI